MSGTHERNLALETALVRDRAEALLTRLRHTSRRRREAAGGNGAEAGKRLEAGTPPADPMIEEAVAAAQAALAHLDQTVAITRRDADEQHRRVTRRNGGGDDRDFFVNWGD